MLMQAAQQVLLFFGPRAAGDVEETFDERTLRHASIKAVIDHGFGPALAIQIGANRMMEVRCPLVVCRRMPLLPPLNSPV